MINSRHNADAGWEEIRLGDFLELKRGYDLPTKRRIAGAYDLISSSGPSDTHAEAKVKGPGVVTGRYGTIGNVFYVEGDFWPLNTTLYVRDFKGSHRKFAYYFLQTLDWSKFNDKSGVPGVNRNDVHREPVRVPSYAEQDTIAETLGALDDKIEANRRMNGTLEAMARAVFRDWFVDFSPTRRQLAGASDPHAILGGLIENPDEAHRLAPLFPARLADNGLPEGWEEGTAENLIEFNPKEPLKKGTVAPYSDMASLPTTGCTAEPPVPREFKSGMRFRRGDALLARITPCLENGKAAFVDFLKDGEIGWGSTEFFVLRATPPVAPALAYCVIRDSDFRDVAIQSMTGTSGRQRAQIDRLKSYPMPVVDDAIHVEFARFVAPLFERVAHNAAENRTLAATRDLLLPKLMSGEIRLATIKLAEPATQAQPEPTFATDLFGDEYLSPEQEEERDAVIVAATVNALRKDNLLVGNVRVMKGSYLIKRKLGLSVGQFERQAAGPYDRALNHEVRSYARDRSWIRETVRHSNGHRIPGNRPARNFSQINPLIEKYGLGDAVKWLNEYFRGATRDWMECVTTVDVAMQELTQRGQPISVEAIKADIASDPEWKPKLSNPHFADAEINRAILHLRKIFAE